MNVIDINEFAGKVAVVTGGSRGLGAAVANILLDGGCSYVANLSLKGGCVIDDPRLKTFKTDVRRKEDIDRAVQKIVNECGRIDILVNCAGVCVMKDFTDLSEDDYDIVVDTNMKGTFLACQSVIPVMEENKYGRIINIASTAGITGGSVGPQYGMSKAGVIALTQSIGRKYAGSGILTNCVAPGDMDTEMVAALFPTEEAKRKRADKIPTGAIAKPEEVARLIAFLASERTTYITGETYRISGGRM
ncbi:MAG: SDR family oxidoreductase [Eubacteriaceae bacterium]|jgi:NAD(P)-dependent dehydrogenase (short-subunit alcohol dehydrogenase family)|nr:SDR family oxidoreductase [Eubacteriaceae bacterium]